MTRLRSRRDDHVLRRHGFSFCFAAHFDLHTGVRLAGGLAVTLQPRDLVLAEQELDALRHLLDNAFLAGKHLREIELHITHVDAVIAEMMQNVFKFFRRSQQRLRRNAAHVKTRAAELQITGRVLPAFNTRNRLAELRCTDRRDVTARARTNHDDIKFFGHDYPSLVGYTARPSLSSAP